jgi:hypothetical protein
MFVVSQAARPAAESAPEWAPDFIDVTGGSGRTYRFNRFRPGHPLSPAGGAFLFARQTDGDIELVYLAGAESLAREADSLLEKAAEWFRAKLLFSRLNVSGRARYFELADILAAHRPPMNAVLEGGQPA